MNTPATEDFPAIEWDQKQLLEKDIDEHSESWEMIGYDEDGKEYSAIGEFCLGELVIITEIELK